MAHAGVWFENWRLLCREGELSVSGGRHTSLALFLSSAAVGRGRESFVSLRKLSLLTDVVRPQVR